MSALMKIFGRKKNDTFVKEKKLPKNSRQYCLIQHKRATLNAGDLTGSIRLPPNTSIEDWYAANVVDFYNEVISLAESIIPRCTNETCPTMSAGAKYQYLWQDNNKYKKPTKLPANMYISLLFDWVNDMLDDQKIFPSDPAVPFPKNFKDIVKQIFKRLFRVYAHIYYHHLDDVRSLDMEASFNTAFRHFYCFVKEFDLIPQAELEPLKQIIQSFDVK